MNVTFVTGNTNKAKYFSELVGMPIAHQAVDVAEIQSLNLMEIAIHKAKEAYSILKSPVIVEDASLAISALGKLPGPLIKWFIEEMELEQICRLADADKNRSAIASDAIAYYDGKILKHFIGSLAGTIAQKPLGNGGYDWDKIFIPHYSKLTLAEMDNQNYAKAHLQVKPMAEIKDFLNSLDKK